MRGLLFKAAVAVLAFSLTGTIVYATPGVPGTPTVDPEANYTPNLANKYYSTETDGRLCQKFTPSRQVIANYVDIRAAGNNTADVYLEIYEDESNLPSNVINTYYAPATFNDGRNTMSRFTSNTDVSVTPGGFYWLCLSGRNAAYWYADSPDGGHSSGTYDHGFLMYGINQRGDEDFGFIIYSSNLEAIPEPEPDPTPSEDTTPVQENNETTNNTNEVITNDQPLPAGVTKGTGEAPTEASDTIAKPIELAVIDVVPDQGGSLKLYWEASTTKDITGYKVFRSTTKGKGYVEIARTEKNILTFTDNDAETGTPYFYIVRAYKDKLESESSNEVKGISVVNIPSSPVSDEQNEGQNSTTLIVVLSVLFVTGLVVLGSAVYWFKFRKPKMLK